MTNIKSLLLLLLTLGLTTGSGATEVWRDTLTQVATIDALLAGVYDGQASFASLKRYGDFGIGTFEALDGELVALDGSFYRVRVDGKVYEVRDSDRTPFATVSFFQPERRLPLDPGMDLEAVTHYLDGALDTPNLFYGLRIEGTFGYVKARSVPAQSRPYPPLAQAIKQQAVFAFRDVQGTLVGYRSPPFVKGINVPGYHLHFLTQDRQAGGHVLDLVVERATVAVDSLSRFYMELPRGRAFQASDLSRDRSEDLRGVER